MKRAGRIVALMVAALLVITSGVAGVTAAETNTADVIIVGAGGAGLAAAVEATSRHAQVIVLEKMPYVGGSSVICGGALAFAGTDMQKALGIQDSAKVLYDDLMKVGQYVNDPAIVQAYVDNQLDTYYWLKNLGVQFTNISAASGMSVPRAHNANPAALIGRLYQAAKDQGAKILLKVAGKRLIQDPQTGRVTGVVAEKDGKEVVFYARKGVILATGGFAKNTELLAQFVPSMVKAQAICGAGCTGDGLKMAWALGAGIKDMPYIKATFGVHPQAKSFSDYFSLAMYHGAIIVNKNAKRFVNESISYKLLADAAFQQPDGIGYQVYDAKIRQDAMKDPLCAIESLESKGLVFKGETLKEAAEKAGLPADALEATVKEYNEYAERGQDLQFGRTSLTSGFGKLVKIETPPFYIYPSTGALLGTYGGITINAKAQVLNVFGEVIPGLYAAGEITGGMHGAAYMTGTAFGKALVFGRIAAKSVLE